MIGKEWLKKHCRSVANSLSQKLSRQKTSHPENGCQTDEQIKKEILGRIINALEKIRVKFFKEAVGYYLRKKLWGYSLSKDVERKVFGKFKKQNFRPIIKWVDEFEFAQSYTDIRDNYIKEYLQKEAGNNFCKDKEFVLNCYERYWMKKAEAKADEIIKENKTLISDKQIKST